MRRACARLAYPLLVPRNFGPQLLLGVLLVALCACAETPPPTPAATSNTPTASRPSGATEPPVGQATPSSVPSTHPGLTASPATTPGPAIDWLAGDPASEFTSSDTIRDTTTIGGRVVAIGLSEDPLLGSRAAAWHSADGALWRRATELAGAEEAAMEDVTVGSAGLVAVGYAALGEAVVPRVWLSTDALAWQAVDDPDLRRGQLSAVAANALGYVALGWDPETGEGLAWTSRDARDWTSPLSVPAFELQPSVNDVIALGDGFLAYGSTERNERAALWTSRDGRAWQLVAGFPSSPSSSVNAVVASGTRLVAVGASYGGEGETLALAWTSTDGLDWQRTLAEDALEFGEMLGVVPVGTGFLAVGNTGAEQREEPRAAVWSSADGLTWQRQPDQPIFARARMSDVVRAGPGLVALGERADDAGLEVFVPVAWLGLAR